jgi:hypothetical protein
MVTKRQLGILTGAAGLIVGLALFGVDLVGAGQWGGFGPLQRLGTAASAAFILVGLILYRLGDTPA